MGVSVHNVSHLKAVFQNLAVLGPFLGRFWKLDSKKQHLTDSKIKYETNIKIYF